MGVITKSYLQEVENESLNRAVMYQRYGNYYKYGAQSTLIVVPEKFKKELNNLGLRRNYCAPVVDAYIAKLRYKGLIVSDDKAREVIEETWHRNRMDAKMIQLHRTAAKKGDAYVIVWPDEEGNIQIQVNSPEFITPITDPADINNVLYFKKEWQVYTGEEVIVRRDVFYPDHIERLWSREGENWAPYTADGKPDKYPNPYGVLPIVHFKNRIDEGLFGISELADAIPIQDDINRIIMDMLMAAGYLGFGQTYIIGTTYKQIVGNNPNGLDKNPGSGWIIPNENAKVGKLAADDMRGLLEAIRQEVQEMATITRTPLHYLQASGGTPSGVSLQELEGPLADKVLEAQVSFGNAYEDINRLILLENGIRDVETSILWQDPVQYIDVKKTQNDIALYNGGAISRKQLLRNQGYTDEQIERIEKEIQQEDNELTTAPATTAPQG